MAQTSDTNQNSKSRKTRSRIENAYLTLMLEKPWDRITVREICQAAELTRGTFYQYFNDIYDLVEQIENRLINDLSSRYEKLRPFYGAPVSLEFFLDRFDSEPPEVFLVWFDFCRDNDIAMRPLLDRKNGDSYFIRRLRRLIEEHVGLLMDHDGMPKDELRSYFAPLVSEIHCFTAQLWLSSEDPDSMLNPQGIVSLLNSLRVGSVFLEWKNRQKGKG